MSAPRWECQRSFWGAAGLAYELGCLLLLACALLCLRDSYPSFLVPPPAEDKEQRQAKLAQQSFEVRWLLWAGCFAGCCGASGSAI